MRVHGCDLQGYYVWLVMTVSYFSNHCFSTTRQAMLMIGASQIILRTRWNIPNQHWMDEKGVAAGWIASKDFLKSRTAVRCLFAAGGKLNFPHWNSCVSTNSLLFYLTSVKGGTWVSQLELQDVREPSFASKLMPTVKKNNNNSLIAIARPSFSLFFASTSLFPPLHAVPPSNHPLNRPMRKWQRKCARNQLLSVSHWHGWVTPLLSSALPVNRARIYGGSGGALW